MSFIVRTFVSLTILFGSSTLEGRSILPDSAAYQGAEQLRKWEPRNPAAFLHSSLVHDPHQGNAVRRPTWDETATLACKGALENESLPDRRCSPDCDALGPWPSGLVYRARPVRKAMVFKWSDQLLTYLY
jgi:hypothetical protein